MSRRCGWPALKSKKPINFGSMLKCRPWAMRRLLHLAAITRATWSCESRATLPLGPQVRMRFKETVEGPSPEKLAHLFQPFNQLGQEAGAEEGTGAAWSSASNWSS